MAQVELGINPIEVWRMTYRELAPCLRLKRTGSSKIKKKRSAQDEIDDFVAKLKAKGVNV